MIYSEFKIQRLFISAIVTLMFCSTASAAIVIGYIGERGVAATQTEWYASLDERVVPQFSAEIKFHEVENIQTLHDLMNSYSMVDLAVLTNEQFRGFLKLADVIGTVEIADGFKLFARTGADEEILASFKKIPPGNSAAIVKEPSAVHQGQANSDFVRMLYRQILHRSADPGGLGFWTGQLDSGAATREQVVDTFKTSDEAKQ